MSKALEGVAMLGSALAMGSIAFLDPAILGTPGFIQAMESLVLGGISMEASAIATALMQNRGVGITTRQAASFRQVIYGEQRVPGVIVYMSTTGGQYDQYNMVIVIATHVIDSIVNLYLDGRQVYWQTGSGGNTTRNGVNFGGSALNSNEIGPGGQHYNFGTLVYCEARFGDQVDGDVISGLTANDPNWAADGHGNSPWLGGCAYVYLKVEYDTAMFPNFPEIRFTVRGKCNIYDPRNGEYNPAISDNYTNNWALIVADVLQDPVYGLGDVGAVNTDQLIAAANVCDEQIALGIGGTESQYCCAWHFDTGTSPGDVLQTMMPAAAGRLSRIGGEWFIWPAYWQGPSFDFDDNALTDALEWTPYRAFRELINRVNGTYIAPNSPWNVAGDLYDANGWYNGSIANQFPFAFTPTNYPQYAQDALHGFTEDAFLIADGGIQLPLQLVQNCVLSVSQAQRCAKITLMRNRQQGSGTFEMSLAAWQMQPLDVMQFTFSANGWSSKLLEITSVAFRIEPPQKEGDAPSIRVQFGVQETDNSVYEWSTAEDLTVYDVSSNPGTAPYIVPQATGVTATSSTATAVVGADGITIPRLLVTWTPPADARVTLVDIQYQEVGASTWTDAGTFPASAGSAYITGVVAGVSYNVQVISIRNTGATSTAAATSSPVTATAPASNTGFPTPTVPTGSINGTNKVFTLPFAPGIILLILNGVIQNMGTDFTLNGSTITYTTAPQAAGDGDWHFALIWT